MAAIRCCQFQVCRRGGKKKLLAHLTNVPLHSQWFGDGLYWGGAVLIALLGQRNTYGMEKPPAKIFCSSSLMFPLSFNRFETFDFAYRVIEAHDLECEKEAQAGKPHEAKFDTQLAVVRLAIKGESVFLPTCKLTVFFSLTCFPQRRTWTSLWLLPRPASASTPCSSTWWTSPSTRAPRRKRRWSTTRRPTTRIPRQACK